MLCPTGYDPLKLMSDSVDVKSTVHSLAYVTQEEKLDLTKCDRNSADIVEGSSSSLEDGWENDPANPRNWSIGKKWVATAIVSAIASYILLWSLIFFV